MDLNTAEGTTRFLRSKTEPVLKIATTASSLIENNHDLYLPNLKIFIFDLILDRLSDDTSKPFKCWKLTPEVWQLLIQTWNSLSDDAQLRNNHFKKFKLVETVVTVFGEVQNHNVLIPIFKFLEIIIRESYISIDENLSVQLLMNYVALLNKQDIDNADEWTKIIYHVYQLPNLKVSNQKFNKKTTTKFFTDCLPVLLTYVNKSKNDNDNNHNNNNNNMGSSSDTFEQIIVKTISNKDSHAYLNHNIKSMISDDSNNNIDAACMTYLFNVIVKSLSKNMDICEQVYLTITASSKFSASLSEPLLAILTSANRTMSVQFLQNIYEKELKTTSGDINWGLIGHLIDLDVDLALDNALDIVQKVSNKLQSKLTIGSKLVQAYARAREFSKFMQEIWPACSWSEDEFIDIVSKHISELSSSQLSAIITNLSTSTSFVIPRLTAVVKGLIVCPTQKSQSVKTLLLSNSAFELNASWEIRYYFLCLYGTDYVIKGENLIINGKNSKQTSEYYFYSIFRMKEFSVDVADKLLKSVIPKYISHLEEVNFKTRESLLMTFLKRWVVLAKNTFSKEELSRIINLIYTNISTNKLIEYFDRYGSLFFEQREVIESLTVKLTEDLEDKKSYKPKSEIIQIIQLIPIQSIPKFLKVKLVDLVSEECTSKLSTEGSTSCLKHLLQQPSFKSNIESNFNVLLTLLSNNPSDSTAQSICKSIWLNNVNTYQELKSKDYVLSTLKLLSKFFKSTKPKKYKTIPTEFEMTFILITATTSPVDDIASSLESLTNEFLSVLLVALQEMNKSKNFAALSWLLNGLLNLPQSIIESRQENFHSISKEIGSNVSNNDNESTNLNLLRRNLFKLKSICLPKNFQNASYLLSLYLVLSRIDDEDLSMIRYLTDYLKSLDEEDIINTHALVLHSLEYEAETGNIEILIQILLCFLNSTILNKEILTKKNSTSVLILSLSKILATLSQIPAHQATLTYIEILKCLKRCLIEVNWCFNQYALETTLALTTKISQEFEKKV